MTGIALDYTLRRKHCTTVHCFLSNHQGNVVSSLKGRLEICFSFKSHSFWGGFFVCLFFQLNQEIGAPYNKVMTLTVVFLYHKSEPIEQNHFWRFLFPQGIEIQTFPVL